jgi:hypothetical protein
MIYTGGAKDDIGLRRVKLNNNTLPVQGEEGKKTSPVKNRYENAGYMLRII